MNIRSQLSRDELQRHFQIVAEATLAETVKVNGRVLHPLLPKTAEELFVFWDAGGSVLAILNGEVVGHATIEPLLNGWFEIGAVWVRKDLRGQKNRHLHIGYRLYKALLEKHASNKFLITTTITPAIMVLTLRVGMVPVRYKDLPPEVWRATCVCPMEKTGVLRSDNVPLCKIKDDGCFVFVSGQTREHIGSPEPLKLPVPRPTDEVHIPKDDILFFLS